MNITNFPIYEEISDSTLQYFNQKNSEKNDPKELEENKHENEI